MGIIYHSEPRLNSPVMVACWPGIGDIGVMAAGTLRRSSSAREFAEIEPYQYFYPKRVFIRGGQLKEIEFPASKFYYSDSGPRHFVIFIGEEQPSDSGRLYAEGNKAFQMANQVIDVAVKLGCSHIYTSGAAVAPIHHVHTPRVWAVPNSEALLAQVRSYENTVLMSQVEDREGQGNITGLNGLLLGVARKRGLDAVCLMGEIPAYLQGIPLPYPKASKSVLDVLGKVLGIEIDLGQMDGFIENTHTQIETLYQSFPQQMREQLDRLMQLQPASREPSRPGGPITEEDKKRIMEDIDKMFKKEPKGD